MTKMVRIGEVEKLSYFELAILIFFASFPWKSVTNYVLEWMGLNFYYYDGLQPEMRVGIINEHEFIVAVTNILCQTKRWFAFIKIVFCTSTKLFEAALNAVKFLGMLKIFVPAQNILWPVKGQGNSAQIGQDSIFSSLKNVW